MKNYYTKKKIILYMLSGIIISIFLAFIFISYIIFPDLFENERKIHQVDFDSAESKIENFLESKLSQNLEIIQKTENINDEDNLNLLLNSIKSQDSDLEQIYILNSEYSNEDTGLDAQKVISSLKDKKPMIVDKLSNKQNGVFVVSFAKVLGQDGVLISKIRNESLEEVAKINNHKSILLGSNSILINSNKGFNVSEKDISDILLKYQTLNSNIIEHNDFVATVGSITKNGWTFVDVSLKRDFYSNSWELIYKILAGTIFLITILFIMFVFLLKKLLKSLDQVTDWMNSIETSNFDVNFSSNGILAEINNKFNNMADIIKGNYEKYIKQTEELSEKNWEVEEANQEIEISYQKLQETINQLNEAEEKYYSLVKNLPEIVCVIELDGTITFTNDAVYDILGYMKEELVENNIEKIFPKDLTQKLLHIMNKKLKRQRKIVMETPINRKDGREIIVEIKLTYHYRNGDVDGVQAIVRDITKNRSLQNEIIHKNKEILTIYNISKLLSSTIEIDSVFNLIVNEVCKIFDANFCVLRLFDYSKKKLVLRAYTGKFFDGVSENEIQKYTNYNAELIQDIIKSRKIVQNAAPDPNWLTENINKTKFEFDQVTNIATIPISSKQEVLGVISLGTRDRIAHKSINILMSVANNAAVAIDNATLYENSKKYFLKTIEALIAAVEAKDKYTEGHSRRVAKYSEIIAKTFELPKNIIENLRVAGILHDIGKIGISDNILLKPGKLTDEEYEEIKQHPIISNRILYSVGLSDITMKAISCHHERYDGKGYPFGLTGDDMDIECQIIGVADAFDAMTSTRSYREALTLKAAILELVKHKGTQFGPTVVDVIEKIYNDTPEILEEISKETDAAS